MGPLETWHPPRRAPPSQRHAVKTVEEPKSPCRCKTCGARPRPRPQHPQYCERTCWAILPTATRIRSGKAMTSDDGTTKSESTPKAASTTKSESTPKAASTPSQGASEAEGKAPSNYSRGEKQK